MSKLFQPESKAILFLNKVADLMLLNLVWLVGCLGIITIGTSTTALYKCLFLMSTGNLAYPFRSFWSYFRNEWKQSTLLWVPMLVTLVFLSVDFYAIFLAKLFKGITWKICFFIVLCVVVPMMLYVFPLQAKFQNSQRQTLKNACLLAIIHFPKSLVIAIVTFAPLFLWLLVPDVFFHTLVLVLFLGRSVPAYWSCHLFKTIFERYMAPEELEKQNAG